MAECFVSEIRPFAGNFAPAGWALCDGSLLDISAYETLYTLIGTTYGGNGTTNFALPDLRGRLPVGQGQGSGLTNRTVGQMDGTSMVQLVAANIPAHSHSFSVSGSNGTSMNATANAAVAVPPGPNVNMYVSPGASPKPTPQSFQGGVISTEVGGNQPHDNVMPYVAINYIIALQGIFPNRPS